MVVDTAKPRLFAKSVVEVHCTAARDTEDMTASAIREKTGDIIGDSHQVDMAVASLKRA
jgi:hypothetical protein